MTNLFEPKLELGPLSSVTDSAAKWLKKLGLGTMKLEVGKWSPNQRGLLL
jgi:hypothetical protein